MRARLGFYQVSSNLVFPGGPIQVLSKPTPALRKPFSSSKVWLLVWLTVPHLRTHISRTFVKNIILFIKLS